MKRLLGLLFVSLWLMGGVQAHAQTAPATAENAAEDDSEEAFFEVLTATAIMNENCKSVLEPTYYEGFRVILRVYYGEMGATNEQVVEQEARAAEFADYICTDKSACWRAATGLSAAATSEDGRQACMTHLTEGFKVMDDFLAPEDET